MYRNQAIERIRVKRANARAMRKATAFICDGLAMVGTVALIVALAGAAVVLQVERASASDIVPCASEDSHDCYWLADSMGNGVGESFVDVGGVAYGLGYSLVHVWQGNAYVVDYDLTLEDCSYALAHSVGDMSCVISAIQ